MNAGETLVLRFSVTMDPFLPKDTAGIVNSDYGVQCAEGLATSGSPVTVNLRWYELFLPIVWKP